MKPRGQWCGSLRSPPREKPPACPDWVRAALGSTLELRKARPFGDAGVNIGETTCSIRDAAGLAGTQTRGSTFYRRRVVWDPACLGGIGFAAL